MNRQMKRMMKRQEAAEAARPRVPAAGTSAPTRSRARAAADNRPKKQRTPLKVYVKESVGELKRVDWPSRPQVQTYTLVVLVCVVVLGAVIAGFDTAVAKAVVGIFT